jgi:DNA mismatch repair protein MutS2
LRNLIRNHLKLYSQIKIVADEHADRGGQGVTLIEMK